MHTGKEANYYRRGSGKRCRTTKRERAEVERKNIRKIGNRKNEWWGWDGMCVSEWQWQITMGGSSDEKMKKGGKQWQMCVSVKFESVNEQKNKTKFKERKLQNFQN